MDNYLFQWVDLHPVFNGNYGYGMHVLHVRSIKPLAGFEALLLIYLLICLFMCGVQRQILYQPPLGNTAPAEYGLNNFNDLHLISGDGTHVRAWYHKATIGYPTIIYFHGRGSSLGERAPYFNMLAHSGFGLIALSYRGYGASEGSPSEAGLYDDARAALSYATQTLALKEGQIILYGESLGSAVAVQMATEYPIGGLVLQSPFTSLEARAEDWYPWLPVRYFLWDRYDSLSKISRVHTKLLLIHGVKDSVIPVEEAETIFAQAHEPKEAIYVPGKGHDDLDDEQLKDALIAFTHKYQLQSAK